MTSWFTGLFDRIFAVIGALTCAQAPMFIQQYTQQLSGRVAELKLQTSAIAGAAAQTHKSVTQYIQRFIDSGDHDFMLQGELMQKMTLRYDNLSEALEVLNTTNIWLKPFVFMRNFSWDIAQSTFHNFQFGIPFTVEGMLYALAGIGLGYGTFAIVGSFCRKFYGIVTDLFKSTKSEDAAHSE